MTARTAFEISLKNNEPPENLSIYLQALWYDAKGNWSKAHSLVDSLSNGTAASVHAYLHRMEGDNTNASFWYRKAGRKMPDISLHEEWKNLVDELLRQQ